MTPPKRTKSPPPSIYSAPLHPRSEPTAILFEPTSIPRDGGFLYLKDTMDPTCLFKGRTSARCAWGAKPRRGLGRVPPCPHPVVPVSLARAALTRERPLGSVAGPRCKLRLRLPPQNGAATYTLHAPPGPSPHSDLAENSPAGWEGQGTARQRARVTLRVAPRQASPPLQLFVSKSRAPGL